MSNLTSRFVENGKHYFATSLTNEEILAQTQLSSNAEVQTLARRIAELADALDAERAARSQQAEQVSRLKAIVVKLTSWWYEGQPMPTYDAIIGEAKRLLADPEEPR